MTEGIEIGAWRFSPASAELRRNGERRALEDRAARVLSLLAEKRGEVVSHEEIIASVWGGRSVSANSVAVVIGDLRRALGDDAKAPSYIETVAKRGYRLAAAPSSTQTVPARNRLFIGLAAAAGAFVFAGALVTSSMHPMERPAIAVTEVSNETGDARYAPLARAVTELVVSNTSSTPRALRVLRSPGPPAPQVRTAVSGRLILWSGHPSVSLSAVDQRSGQVIWSAIAPGPEDSLPVQVHDKIAELKAVLASREMQPL
jgi:DNA-binding winged helix-turn-helix (wHTH) protein